MQLDLQAGMREKGEPGRSRLSGGAAFAVASCGLVLVFAAAGAPIPLYNTYGAADRLGHEAFAIAAVGYFVTAAVALLTLGRLSNHVGRRPISLAAIACAAAGSLLLTGVHGVGLLLAGRVLQGLACGIASSSLGAYVVDTAPSRPRWLAAAITGSAPMVGVPLGALLSGALVEYGPAPRTLVYEIVAAGLAVCALLLALSPETVRRAPGAFASLRPRLQVPAGSRRLLFAAGAAFTATWSLGGFYQAFGPLVIAERLGTANALVAAAGFSCVMVLNPLGAPIAGRWSPVASMRSGMTLFIVAAAAIVWSLRAGAIVPFLLATLTVGLAQGVASTAAIRALLSRASQEERAGLLSTIYLISYCGAALPALLAGELTNVLSLTQLAEAYAGLGIVSALLAMAATRTSSARLSD
jgi:MFS family permease